jgi:hypothetical protein
VLGSDEEEGYGECRHERVQEIVLTEEEVKLGEEKEDDAGPPDNSRIFLVATGYEEQEKSNTGYQDQVLDHYRIIQPATKKRIL